MEHGECSEVYSIAEEQYVVKNGLWCCDVTETEDEGGWWKMKNEDHVDQQHIFQTYRGNQRVKHRSLSIVHPTVHGSQNVAAEIQHIYVISGQNSKVVLKDFQRLFMCIFQDFPWPFMSIFHIFPATFSGTDNERVRLSYAHEYLTLSSKLN